MLASTLIYKTLRVLVSDFTGHGFVNQKLSFKFTRKKSIHPSRAYREIKNQLSSMIRFNYPPDTCAKRHNYLEAIDRCECKLADPCEDPSCKFIGGSKEVKMIIPTFISKCFQDFILTF